ncbi:hypothetical protein COMA2_30126 [Candidatus Nitrospira nitrificans]|uniref:Uncharacterized protein n=1 Tax=Candidatus Nitrospira nitrificans TaxID=1742973 RepID=A0A0S4LMH6_9BACT|nr:hypothetical protein COMA2_30126 [Candidatus Nitrospira nitrificans]
MLSLLVSFVHQSEPTCGTKEFCDDLPLERTKPLQRPTSVLDPEISNLDMWLPPIWAYPLDDLPIYLESHFALARVEERPYERTLQ